MKSAAPTVVFMGQVRVVKSGPPGMLGEKTREPNVHMRDQGPVST